MFYKSFQDINEKDIDDLIEENTTESETLEFKKIIRHDLLVRSFIALSNTNGGMVIFGIHENKEAKTIEKSPIDDIQGNQPIEDWLRGVIMANVIPKPLVPKVKKIQQGNGKCLLLMEVEPSFNKPHSNNDHRTYIRHGTSSDSASPDEIRRMVLDSQQASVDKEKFLAKRHLLEEDDPLFGQNYWGSKLNRDGFKDNGGRNISGITMPSVICSFMPSVLKNGVAPHNDKTFHDFLLNLQKDCYPIKTQRKHLLPRCFRANLSINDVSLLSETDSSFPQQSKFKKPWSYIEFTHQGYVEMGIGSPHFWIKSKNNQNNEDDIIVCKCEHILGRIGAYVDFCVSAYQHLDIMGKAELRIAFVGCEEMLPIGFGKKNKERKWLEIYDQLDGYEQHKCREKNFIINHIVDVENNSETEALLAIKNISKQLSFVFNMKENRFLMDDNEFDISRLNDLPQ